jgi:hypothetical protein
MDASMEKPTANGHGLRERQRPHKDCVKFQDDYDGSKCELEPDNKKNIKEKKTYGRTPDGTGEYINRTLVNLSLVCKVPRRHEGVPTCT